MNEKEELTDDDIKEKNIVNTAALGFAVIYIFVGLPLWWKTTEVYRVSLPYSEIENFNHDEISSRIQIACVIFDDDVHESQMFQSLSAKLNANDSLIGGLNLVYQFKVRNALDSEKKDLHNHVTIEEIDDHLSTLNSLSEPGKIYIVILPKQKNLLASENGLIGKHRIVYVNMGSDYESDAEHMARVIRNYFIEENNLNKILKSRSEVLGKKSDKASMRSVRFNPAYELNFVLFNPQPELLRAEWDIQRAVKNYVQPFINNFKDTVVFNIKSQYMHYVTGMNMRATKDHMRNGSILKEEYLHLLINPIESHIGTHISSDTLLNFVLFIPPKEKTPLYFLDDKGEDIESNSFLSPRWGSILVHNVLETRTSGKPPVLMEVEMNNVMETFMSHLRLHLGINTLPKEDIEIMNPALKGISDWELDKWIRTQTLQNIVTASSTLKSLIQLLEKVKNIVINDAIGLEVSKAISKLQKAQELLIQGKWKEAYKESKLGYVSSEKAFFDPSLLELLYFPEDQKFAIYIPLFLPVSIPVILSIVNAIKWYKFLRKRKQKEE